MLIKLVYPSPKKSPDHALGMRSSRGGTTPHSRSGRIKWCYSVGLDFCKAATNES